MNYEVALICSTTDTASLNIAKNLLDLVNWDDTGAFKTFKNFRLIIQDKGLLTLNSLDEYLQSLDLNPKMVVFASRHQSAKKIPWLGGHFTGESDVRNYRLSVAAPAGLRSFLLNIKKTAPPGYQISAEATHHGPSTVILPSFFAEIGSCEEQWSDPKAGEVVARAILDLDCHALPVFIGFGGGHYMQRQTNLMLETNIAFGHMFSNYQINHIDQKLMKQARSKSGSDYAYIDRKSLKAEERNKLAAILDEIDLPLLRSKEIRARFPMA
jgi:D-aminoacyl-tRNA deacylase